MDPECSAPPINGRFPKPAYTVSEFADLFGRHKSWAYRLIYNRRVKVIDDFGRMMIPSTEVEAITTSAKLYEASPKN